MKQRPTRQKPLGPDGRPMPRLGQLLQPYRTQLSTLVLIALSINALTLVLPKLISHSIDDFIFGRFDYSTTILWFSGIAILIFGLTYAQSIMQTLASERVARDLREQLSDIISQQSYATIQRLTPATLLTNLTSDIDSIKMFVAQAIVSLVSSVVTIFGAAVLLLSINWKLALAVLTIIPIIGGTFFFVLSKVRKLFLKTREIVDWLNRVINESILGSALIRVLHSQRIEYEKFLEANTNAQTVGLQILRLFATMIPIVTFVASLATIIILGLGGHFVIAGSMTLGDFAAFNSYLSTLIFPIFVIGFMSNVIAQATASYGRVRAVLDVPIQASTGTITTPLRGYIDLTNVSVNYGDRSALKDVTIAISPGSKTAIVGPTAAGKTQILYLLIGLIEPAAGTVMYDGKPMSEYDPMALHRQVGFVFQDSIIFNMSLRENIAFSEDVSPTDLEKAIATAELTDFVQSLPDGLDTIMSERGVNVSGGQKQRIMLARALALHPKILLLDDFTARVDAKTEKTIITNVMNNYPDLTLVSVTQKIHPIKDYDQIIVLMEGEVIGSGTHNALLQECPEYIQIYDSQQSTHAYE